MKLNNILCGLAVALFAITANAESENYEQTLDSIERQIKTETERYAEKLQELDKMPRCVSGWRLIFDPTCEFQNNNIDVKRNSVKITHEANIKVLQKIKEGIIEKQVQQKESEDYKYMKGF